MRHKDDLIISQKAPLNKDDTETQTFGCRHTNPSICSSNSLEGICAFVAKDSICKRPPRSWKRIYSDLKAVIHED
jgi:hypothetical protein